RRTQDRCRSLRPTAALGDRGLAHLLPALELAVGFQELREDRGHEPREPNLASMDVAVECAGGVGVPEELARGGDAEMAGRELGLRLSQLDGGLRQVALLLWSGAVIRGAEDEVATNENVEAVARTDLEARLDAEVLAHQLGRGLADVLAERGGKGVLQI